ncbi:MBL fold metallo-hydrolase [Natrialbaceae archaeon A-gly3]
MEEPGYVHALPVAVEYGAIEMTITPTAIETERGLVLVDVGPEGIADALEVHLADLGYGLEDVWLALVTHHDGDHVGGVEEIRARADPIVAAHPEETPYLTGEREPQKGDPEEYPTTAVDLEVTGGVRVPTLAGPMVVRETPGHTPGHVSLHLPEKELLIAGDALVADGEEPLSGPKPEYTADLERALESVSNLETLEISRTLCFHGGYVEEGAERIGEVAETGRQ